MSPKGEPQGKPPVSRTTVFASFGRILSLARGELPALALGTVFLLLSSASNLAFPQGIRFIIDDAMKSGGTEKIDRIALIMLGVFFVQGVTGSLRYMAFTSAGERVVAKLRERLFESLMGQEIAFFDGQKTGELTNRLSSDATVLQNAVSVNISMALRNLTAVLGGMVLLFYTSPRLTMLMLAVVPPVAFAAVRYGRRVRKLSADVQDSLARSTDVAEEALAGIRTVRSFSAEGSEVARFGRAVAESLRLAMARIRIAATFFGIASFAAYAAGAAVFWYGGHLVVRGQLSIGELTSFLVYTLLVAFSLGSLSELWADFNRASGASARIFALIDRKPEMPSGGRTLANVKGHVRFLHVQFSYPARPDVRVLTDFDLDISPGEVVALVGPSGAGKSTISALLYRLYDPEAGVVSLDGEPPEARLEPLAGLDAQWLRRQVGVVAQEPLLFSSSIADNIRYGRPEATDEEIRAAAKLANAHDFIDKFPDKYDTAVGERGVQLSGGQKQRVAIARAVLKDPKVLILDEATSALDAESEFLVREALERLMKGRTTLVIAHRLSSVKNADRVVVLEGGKIAQTGKHSELVVEEGLYKRLVERQLDA